MIQAPRCPYCRTRVTVVLPFFSEEEREAAAVEDIQRREDVRAKVRIFNRRFSGKIGASKES